ncbi:MULTISPECIES: multidrug effflux MFS transporter [unclassified Rhodococcus (in: high G+C Gram-positive bacteria)]|uniref:multidrug effflux MFS transporter n=1 Tax=unclassified Rhodococcus (in: high G+C Gram-positive bacteria) TaxID=192944 RepID=UPI001639C1F3|nr:MULTISPECIES: multidrug effflux MFS transporter [unclassified Rhodococcus (in: high G+C Gram-positive bacteria)]MBC2638966.1 multidrug effflux MFS transporter [Rhodococcus sp. 3A]MBC2896293.1 multidrug effflux MFS transporter [Rhodococcus sp. 4CII]
MTDTDEHAVVTADRTTTRPSLRVILVLGAMVALGPFTIDMYLPALPDIGTDLGASSSAVQLTITGTLLGLALGQLIVGPLSDSLGRRRPLIAGIAVHVVASALAVFAPTVAVLGVLRVFQGIGAAAAAVVALAVVRDLFSGNTVAVVMSRLMLVLGVAPVLAPSIGGALLIAVDWRGIFVVLAVIGTLTALIGVWGLTETLPPERRRRSNLRAVLATYTSLLGDRAFMVLALVSSVAMGSLFSYVSGASFVFQDQYGLDEQQFALLFSSGAIALIGASQLNVRALARWSPLQITVAALGFATVAGLALVTTAQVEFGGLAGFVVPLWFLLGGVGFVLPNAPALALGRHGEAAGTAAALLGALQFGVGALIAPLVGVLGNTGVALAVTMTACVGFGLVALASAARTEAR